MRLVLMVRLLQDDTLERQRLKIAYVLPVIATEIEHGKPGGRIDGDDGSEIVGWSLLDGEEDDPVAGNGHDAEV